VSIRIALRADASPVIGTGHVMRSLVLADALRVRGAETVLLSRALPERLRVRAEKGGHLVVDLPSGSVRPAHVSLLGHDERADAALCIAALKEVGGVERLIVDHYGLGALFERTLRPHVSWIAVIDDLADRAHDCEVLLDQSLYPEAEGRYTRLVPSTCTKLIGPRYALLREEFEVARRWRRQRDGPVRDILVFFGGGDTCGMTLRALEAIKSLAAGDVHVTVVATGEDPHLEALRRACDGLSGTTLRVDVENMAEVMSHADLSIGAGGTATWERCYLGLPNVFATIAVNQFGVAREVAIAGAGIDLGPRPQPADIGAAIRSLLNNPARVREMSRAAAAMMAGARAGRRHELAMRVMSGGDRCLLRPVGPADRELLHGWRNSDRVRFASLSDQSISVSEHGEWFLEMLKSDTRLYYVFEMGGQPVGVVHLDQETGSAGSALWGFYVGVDSAPSGSGMTMCRLGLYEAFVVEGLRCVRAEVLAANERSLHVHERLGFKRTAMRTLEGVNGSREAVLLALDREAWKPSLSAQPQALTRKMGHNHEGWGQDAGI